MTAASDRAAFEAALDRISPEMRRAFLDAVRAIVRDTTLRALDDAIARGDVDAAFAALRMEPEAFARLDQAIEAAYRQGADLQLASLPLQRVRALAIRFNGRHERAEAWVRERAAGLIVEVIEDQRAAVRVTVEAGLQAGRSPRGVALDVAGRMDGGTRRGGIVGLTSGQARYVANLRAELADPERLAAYFDRQRRDRRLDPIVRRAMREGRPVAPADVERIAGRYADRLLNLRGETVARTEALAALNAGRHEAARQMVESGKVPAEAVRMVWDATPSRRTRDSHIAMSGQSVPFGQPFISPLSGARMMFPGDVSLGAPPGETINCRCGARTVVDWASLAV